ncbi:MAG: DUF1929 domain-containing protein [Chloroflexi bacterium]|nr:DUF1929 domain-containing protein [Chloroflexota bacterium]
MPWPLAGIHAALLPTGKVLHFSYPLDGLGAESWLWDPQTAMLKEVPVDRNLFCGGQSFLPDGRLLVTGGTDPASPAPHGLKDMHTFDPSTETWSYAGDMQVGRWYPTNVTLPDGRTLVLSGRDEQGDLTNVVEIYDPASGSQVVSGANQFLNLYPWMHVLPSGKVFNAGPTNLTSEFDPATATWQAIAPNNYGARQDGSSVLLPLRPPDYRPEVLIMGGDNPATNTAEMIDLEEQTPAWSPTGSMNYARHHANPVLLPDGKLLVVGGTPVANSASEAVLAAELFDPETATWTEMASMVRPRIYHSTAILLPDGRVLAAGTDGEFTAEIYSPPYLFQGPRPEISSAPPTSAYGNTFQVSSPDAQDIAKVVLIRPAAVTHSVNMEQRYVEMEFVAGSGVLTVQAPPSANLAPKGYYMLFVVNSAGIPSEATFILLGEPTDSDGDGLTDDAETIVYGTDPLVSDTDGDGFSDGDEVFMGTEPLVACAATATANDEGPADAWPFDFDDNQRAALGDVIGFIPVFNTFAPGPPYDPRFDLDASGGITLGDVLSYVPVFNLLCTP